MANVYLVTPDSTQSAPMTPFLAKNEDKELQCLLESNFDLLPGDQIEPDEPCRWLLIRREMPVPHPSTGLDHWNIDFLFVDQNATPTFVECKRFLDTRARREVVGQVLEYAANGQHHWSGAVLRAHAENTAKKDNTTLENCLAQLHSERANGPSEFFEEAERRLKSGEIRIVFFMEQAPVELKRLVEYLNAQMTTVDVLLVEARQYVGGGARIVVPTLFGFTERIREVKRAVANSGEKQPIASNWEEFATNATARGVPTTTVRAMRQVYDAALTQGAVIAWGRGTATGSFSPKWPTISAKGALFSVYSDGRLELHFPAFQSTEQSIAFAERLAAGIRSAGLQLPANHLTTWFSFAPETWTPVADQFVSAVQAALAAAVDGAQEP